MASRVGIWALREGLPRRAERSKVALEMDLEDWCTHDPGLLYEGLKVVGRQVHCDGGYIDLLGLDVQGRWVVVELKRERLYREAVIQAIDYASSIRHMETDRLEQAIEKTVGVLADPETARQRVRFQLDAEGEEREVTIVVAGTLSARSMTPSKARPTATIGSVPSAINCTWRPASSGDRDRARGNDPIMASRSWRKKTMTARSVPT